MQQFRHPVSYQLSTHHFTHHIKKNLSNRLSHLLFYFLLAFFCLGPADPAVLAQASAIGESKGFNSSVLASLSATAEELSTIQQIRLRDKDDLMPISGAFFEYGNQRGVSDPAGTISFYYREGEIMRVSHVSYGSWTWKDEKVQRLIEKGIYHRSSITFDLYPVTIVALRPKTRPEEKKHIDHQERMAHDASTLLNQFTAFSSIRKSGNYGFDPVFRGFKYDQLNIVLDGAQSATAACPNRMDPPTSQMAPNMLERIEILKGPYALRYGSGFGATINFIPAPLRFSEETSTYGRISTGYESNGNILRSETQAGYSGTFYDISLFGAWSQGDNYTTGSGDIVQADFARGSFGARLGLKPAPNQKISISGTYNRALDADFPALPMDLRRDDTWMLNARHDFRISGEKLLSWNTTLFGSWVDHLMNNHLKQLETRMANAETSAQTYNYGGRTEGTWKLGKGVLYTGSDLRVEGAKGTRVREFISGSLAGSAFRDNVWQKAQIIKTGFFSEYQRHTGQWNYVLSGRLEWNRAEIRDPDQIFALIHPQTLVIQLNPSFSGGALRSFDFWGENIETGLWIGRTRRSGSLIERFINFFPVGQDPYEMVGNPGLSPEVNNQMDVTFVWKRDHAVLNMDLFASYLQDFISSVIDTSLSPRLAASPGVRPYTNIEQAFKTGFEVRWTQELPYRFRHILAIAYTYAQDLKRDEPLPEIAPLDLRYSFSWNSLDHRMTLESSVRHVMKQSRISREFGETKTPSFTLFDIQMSYRITNSLNTSLGVRNLFNVTYHEHLNRPVRGSSDPVFAPGRNAYITMTYLF